MWILGNAIKFTDKGSVVLRVTMGRQPGHVEFSVIDTGIGISAEQHHRLFKPFSQADSSTARRFGGSGLGLALCADIARLLDGDISFESTPGFGSVFHLDIPFLLPSDVPGPQSTVNVAAGEAGTQPTMDDAQSDDVGSGGRLAARLRTASAGSDVAAYSMALASLTQPSARWTPSDVASASGVSLSLSSVRRRRHFD